MYNLDSKEWQCALPKDGRYPQGAFHARFDSMPSGQLRLTTYALVEDAVCGTSDINLTPRLLPVLESYTIESADAVTGIMHFAPAMLYQAAVGTPEQWQKLCTSQRQGIDTECGCTSASINLGRKSPGSSLFEWTLKQPAGFGRIHGANNMRPC
jgi:hypothetical protein